MAYLVMKHPPGTPWEDHNFLIPQDAARKLCKIGSRAHMKMTLEAGFAMHVFLIPAPVGHQPILDGDLSDTLKIMRVDHPLAPPVNEKDPNQMVLPENPDYIVLREESLAKAKKWASSRHMTPQQALEEQVAHTRAFLRGEWVYASPLVFLTHEHYGTLAGHAGCIVSTDRTDKLIEGVRDSVHVLLSGFYPQAARRFVASRNYTVEHADSIVGDMFVRMAGIESELEDYT